MKPDQFVVGQLVARLKRVKRQIATLSAEAEMIERMLVDAEKSATVPRLKLRRNSHGKWTVRSQVRQYLIDNPAPAKVQAIYDFLKRYDTSLKSSTFRSHIKRMVDDEIIKREGSRGHYQLVTKPVYEPKELDLGQRRPLTRFRYP